MDKVKEKDGVGRRVEVGGGEVIRKKFAPASKWERVKIWKQEKKKDLNPLLLSLFFFFSLSYSNASRLDTKTMVGRAYN